MFSFQPFAEIDLVALRRWLNSEHVKEFWQETDDDEKLKKKFLEDLPKRGVWAFTVIREQEKIGYIQYYDATKVGGGWWPTEPAGTFGIDILIGAPDLTGQGLGTKIIDAFVSFVSKKEPSLNSIIIDPDPKNQRAVRAFAKAGFMPEGEITTPGGAALLMRLPRP